MPEYSAIGVNMLTSVSMAFVLHLPIFPFVLQSLVYRAQKFPADLVTFTEEILMEKFIFYAMQLEHLITYLKVYGRLEGIV